MCFTYLVALFALLLFIMVLCVDILCCFYIKSDFVVVNVGVFHSLFFPGTGLIFAHWCWFDGHTLCRLTWTNYEAQGCLTYMLSSEKMRKCGLRALNLNW